MIEDRGEEEVIALALVFSALIVLDDKRARNYARRVGLQLTGTLGVLLRLHHPRLASRVLKEDLRLLEEADMRVQVRVLGGSLSWPISISAGQHFSVRVRESWLRRRCSRRADKRRP